MRNGKYYNTRTIGNKETEGKGKEREEWSKRESMLTSVTFFSTRKPKISEMVFFYRICVGGDVRLVLRDGAVLICIDGDGIFVLRVS